METVNKENPVKQYYMKSNKVLKPNDISTTDDISETPPLIGFCG